MERHKIKNRPGEYPAGSMWICAIERLAIAVKRIQFSARGEMVFLDLVPAAENIIDVDEANAGELVLELGRNLFIVNAVTELSGNALAFFGIKEVEVRLCQFARVALVHNLVDDRDREFGKQADGRHNAFELVRTAWQCHGFRPRR